MLWIGGVVVALLQVSWAAQPRHRNEIKRVEHLEQLVLSALPHEYLEMKQLPESWDWSNVDGVNYLTKNLNQHIPQYCGSCWAHGALSALADRIKIARRGKGIDINLAIQFILNCGDAGSCHGGDQAAVYSFISKTGFVPFDTCLLYEACSKDSTEGKCSQGNWECSRINTCRTCSTFESRGGFCSEIDVFPNASIAEYGMIQGEEAMMKEVFARGPITCEINSGPLHNYTGGILDDPTARRRSNHVVSVYGWGVDRQSGKKYWRIRNSWGEYTGEMGHVRLVRGDNQLAIESNCAWATPATWTEQNTACYEDGSNCVSHRTARYIDASREKPWHFSFLQEKDVPI